MVNAAQPPPPPERKFVRNQGVEAYAYRGCPIDA